MNLKQALSEIYLKVKNEPIRGAVANYIPPLSKVSPKHFALSLITVDGEEFHFGESDTPFSIQSISKVFVLAKLLQEKNVQLWKRVGKEPSGMPYNSLIQLEMERGIPRNPFINSGALVTTDILLSSYKSPEKSVSAILNFLTSCSKESSHKVDIHVANAEIDTGFKNLSMAYLMKSFDNLNNDVNEIFETYCKHCSITMSTYSLAHAALFLAKRGLNSNDQIILPRREIKRINSIMQTCGAYDDAGEIAYRVGLPVKSGVGGGVLGVFPGKFAVIAWSPPLNSRGTSIKGMRVLELLTTKIRDSIF